MGKTTFLILFFISSVIYGQTTIEFENFIKLFPETNLPTCIKYSEKEFQTEYYTSNDTKVKERIPFHDHILPKDSSLNIKYALVQTFFLADTEKVTPLWPDNSPQSDTIFPTYYISTCLTTTKNFICLIYERQFRYGNNPYAEKYLCTLTKTGKLIDKVLVASADYSGTGILADNFRVPWFPDKQSSISNDLTIILKNPEDNKDEIYQVDDNGKINKQKASH
jgi:hypothetical protein